MKTQTSVDSTSIDDDEVIRRILATVRSKTGQDFATTSAPPWRVALHGACRLFMPIGWTTI